ncbi:MAG: TIGR03915 family putative DNA repair protein [Lachnospiraceae bacterium]|nr:TIGR03915 family putative DNA repair protein [Lachnospiraceae bacterium]
MFVYQCEDSLESIFTAIYNVYEDKNDPQDVYLDLSGQPRLFAVYIPVLIQTDKVKKVMRSLKRDFGEEDTMRLCYALTSPAEDKAQAVFQTISLGIANRRGRTSQGHLFDQLANHWVNRAFVLYRAASCEQHQLTSFVRFSEVENRILLSKIAPKNNILAFLMPHFSDRLPAENFMIYDTNRDFFGIHPAGGDWYFVLGSDIVVEKATFTLSAKEHTYRSLFRSFCESIAIKERINKNLQRTHLPLRYREYMVEFEHTNFDQESIHFSRNDHLGI